MRTSHDLARQRRESRHRQLASDREVLAFAEDGSTLAAEIVKLATGLTGETLHLGAAALRSFARELEVIWAALASYDQAEEPVDTDTLAALVWQLAKRQEAAAVLIERIEMANAPRTRPEVDR